MRLELFATLTLWAGCSLIAAWLFMAWVRFLFKIKHSFSKYRAAKSIGINVGFSMVFFKHSDMTDFVSDGETAAYISRSGVIKSVVYYDIEKRSWSEKKQGQA